MMETTSTDTGPTPEQQITAGLAAGESGEGTPPEAAATTTPAAAAATPEPAAAGKAGDENQPLTRGEARKFLAEQLAAMRADFKTSQAYERAADELRAKGVAPEIIAAHLPKTADAIKLAEGVRKVINRWNELGPKPPDVGGKGGGVAMEQQRPERKLTIEEGIAQGLRSR